MDSTRSPGTTIKLDISSGIATLTLDRPEKRNALLQVDFTFLSDTLRKIDARDDVTVTIIQSNGDYFSSGGDLDFFVHISENPREYIGNTRKCFSEMAIHGHLDVGNALYPHRKILIAALNGPVMGLMASFLGYFDIIYALPGVWLKCPFTSLGMAVEGGASVSFVNRMGLAMTNEVLILGKQKSAQELLSAGFINKIYPNQPTPSFHAAVRHDVLADFKGLYPEWVLTVKAQIKAGLNEKNNMDAVNLREAYGIAASGARGQSMPAFANLANSLKIKSKM